jgi:hypothetical protein
MASFSLVSLLFLAAAPTVLVGCGGRGSAGQEPKPFALTATEDIAHRSSTHIKAAKGGAVETVDGQGTRYRLTIPARAMLTDADIVITPLSGIAGVPGQTMHYGVDITPAGTRLYELALLEIVPASLLPKDVYWLETEGPASRPLARPGFPASGKPGVLLSHFSGGTVVSGGPQTSAAMHPGMNAAPGSRDWLEWRRDVARQDRETGRDTVTPDAQLEIIERRLQELAIQELVKQLARDTEQARRDLEHADSIADHGDLKDAQAIFDAFRDAAIVEKKHQVLGAETDILSTYGAAVFKFYAALLRKCEMQHLDPKMLLGLERMLQIGGYESAPGNFEKCAKASGAVYVVSKAEDSGDDPGDEITRVAQGKRVQQAADRVATYASTIH